MLQILQKIQTYRFGGPGGSVNSRQDELTKSVPRHVITMVLKKDKEKVLEAARERISLTGEG